MRSHRPQPALFPITHSADCYIQMKDKVSAIIALEMAIKRAHGKPEFKTLEDRQR